MSANSRNHDLRLKYLTKTMDDAALKKNEVTVGSGNFAVLTWRTKLCFGVGHILNDLCANVWFSYLLLYMHNVVGLDPVTAGSLLLVGQVADALSTPVVGIESDRTSSRNYGRRKLWHLLGVCCVAFSFPFIFTKCLGCHGEEDYVTVIYYVPFIVVFQFGWASSQISHLALIPELTECKMEQVTLNAIRYAGTVSSGIVAYVVFWLLIDDMKETEKIGSKDHTEFMYLAFIVVGIGLVFMAIFHLGVRERPRKCYIEGQGKGKRSAKNWILWFREAEFYKVGLIYMCTRLVVNISQVYTPLFTKVTLKNHKEILAIVPFIIFVSGFGATLVAKPLNTHLGQRATYALGLFIILGNCVWASYLEASNDEVYGFGVLLGLGGSLSLVTCLGMVSHLIEDNIETGAFVYGAMSFLDKLANGIAVQIIQIFHPRKSECPACFYRHIIVFVPGVAAVIALLISFLLKRESGSIAPSSPKNMTDCDVDKESLLSTNSGSIQDNYGSLVNEKRLPEGNHRTTAEKSPWNKHA